jgi:hypothetical protein
LEQLRMNGTVVWEDGSARAAGIYTGQDGLHIPVQSGSYSLIARYNCEGNPSQP